MTINRSLFRSPYEVILHPSRIWWPQIFEPPQESIQDPFDHDTYASIAVQDAMLMLEIILSRFLVKYFFNLPI